eukprot:413427-Prymnesium_polylepis.1
MGPQSPIRDCVALGRSCPKATALERHFPPEFRRSTGAFSRGLPTHLDDGESLLALANAVV